MSGGGFHGHLGCVESADSCRYTNDGECDEPNGTGVCAEGTDAADCGGVAGQCSGHTTIGDDGLIGVGHYEPHSSCNWAVRTQTFVN